MNFNAGISQLELLAVDYVARFTELGQISARKDLYRATYGPEGTRDQAYFDLVKQVGVVEAETNSLLAAIRSYVRAAYADELETATAFRESTKQEQSQGAL